VTYLDDLGQRATFACKCGGLDEAGIRATIDEPDP
jgi:hypothetical protein